MKFNEYLSVLVYKLVLITNLINEGALSEKDKHGKVSNNGLRRKWKRIRKEEEEDDNKRDKLMKQGVESGMNNNLEKPLKTNWQNKAISIGVEVQGLWMNKKIRKPLN